MESESPMFFILLSIFLIPLFAIMIFWGLNSKVQEDVHVKVYKDNVLLLEYTGKRHSINYSGNGYSFTVDEKIYIFKEVDTIEVTNPEEQAQ